MCIDTRWSDRKTQNWLKKWIGDKSETMTVYKVCIVGKEGEDKERITPPIYALGHGPYKRTNKMLKIELEDMGKLRPIEKSAYGMYRANYHLFLKKGSVKRWITQPGDDIKVLRCEVLKKDITAMGRQNGSVVVVTKRFKFVEGLQYFGKKKGPK